MIKLFVLVILLPSVTWSAPVNLLPFVEFAAEWTTYKYHGEPLPKVKKERDSMVQIMAYGDFAVGLAERKGQKLPSVNAVYSSEDNTLYYSDRFDGNDQLVGPAYAHEMVHFLQKINGYTETMKDYMVCTESEAYDVQMLWQKFNNVDVESIGFVYQQSMLAATWCMGNKGKAISNAFANRTRF